MLHDCKNCPQQGKCDIEKTALKLKLAFRLCGVKGLANDIIPAFHVKPFTKEAEDDMLWHLHLAIDILLFKPPALAAELNTLLRAGCPEGERMDMLKVMLAFHMGEATQAVIQRLMDKMGALGEAFGIPLHAKMVSAGDMEEAIEKLTDAADLDLSQDGIHAPVTNTTLH